MSLEISKKKYYKTSGNESSNGMGLFNNEWVFNRESSVSANEFYLPMFCGSTGTYEYYEQDSNSTYNLFGRVSLDFYATGTTASTPTQGYVQNAWLDDRLMYTRFDIYKIPFEDSLDYDKVLEHISTPYTQYTATTATTRGHALSGEVIGDSFRYNFKFSPAQSDKPNKGYTEVLFEDRSQYLFNPVYSLYNDTNEYSASFQVDDNGFFSNYNHTGRTSFITKGKTHKIQKGTWSGNVIQGLFFVTIQPPNKPNIETPLPIGNTFTPAFFFSNVEDGDEYVLEVEYGDLGEFDNSDTIEQYFRKKTDDSLEQVVSHNGTELDNSIVATTTTIRTRRIEAALIPNRNYCWRIGNIKFVIDLFGIKRSVITYSDVNCSLTEENANIISSIDNNVRNDTRQSTSVGNSDSSGGGEDETETA